MPQFGSLPPRWTTNYDGYARSAWTPDLKNRWPQWVLVPRHWHVPALKITTSRWSTMELEHYSIHWLQTLLHLILYGWWWESLSRATDRIPSTRRMGTVPDVWERSSKSVARGGRHSAVDSGCSRSPSAYRARSSECWFIPSWFPSSINHTIFSNYLFPSPKTIHDTFFCGILCVPDFNNSDWILLISCTLTISNIPTFFCHLQAQ